MKTFSICKKLVIAIGFLQSTLALAADINFYNLKGSGRNRGNEYTLICQSQDRGIPLKLWVGKVNETLVMYYTFDTNGRFPVLVGSSNQLCGEKTGGSTAVDVDGNYFSTNKLRYSDFDRASRVTAVELDGNQFTATRWYKGRATIRGRNY